jgi:hypothetical protein
MEKLSLFQIIFNVTPIYPHSGKGNMLIYVIAVIMHVDRKHIRDS